MGVFQRFWKEIVGEIINKSAWVKNMTNYNSFPRMAFSNPSLAHIRKNLTKVLKLFKEPKLSSFEKNKHFEVEPLVF